MKRVTIHWGEAEMTHRESPPETYKFRTAGERDAFLNGVKSAVGYGDFAVIEAGERCGFCGCDADGSTSGVEEE